MPTPAALGNERLLQRERRGRALQVPGGTAGDRRRGRNPGDLRRRRSGLNRLSRLPSHGRLLRHPTPAQADPGLGLQSCPRHRVRPRNTAHLGHATFGTLECINHLVFRERALTRNRLSQRREATSIVYFTADQFKRYAQPDLGGVFLGPAGRLSGVLPLGDGGEGWRRRIGGLLLRLLGGGGVVELAGVLSFLTCLGETDLGVRAESPGH